MNALTEAQRKEWGVSEHETEAERHAGVLIAEHQRCNPRPAEVVVSGSVVVVLRGGRCAGCGAERMIFINKGGRTVCAGCSGTVVNALNIHRTFMVLLCDESGPLDSFFQSIERKDLATKLIDVAKALWPRRDLSTVLDAKWAENPRLYCATGDDVFVITIPGTHELPKARASKPLPKVPKQRDYITATAADVADHYERLDSVQDWKADPGLRGVAAREKARTPVAAPAETSVEVVAKCCGISHTRGSYAALELLGATDRTEGFTAIHEERRACGCCKAVLVVETRRLIGGK